MKIFTLIQEIKNYINSNKKEGKTIGFVPTMGALHQGHISLLEKAKKENNITAASIFVNPLQFNNKEDLKKYPRTLETDLEKLNVAGCDVVFNPTADEMYFELRARNQKTDAVIDLEDLDKVMEGVQRPRHFQGVCIVVKKLFEIIEPNKAYFGEKDFQQLAVIKHMVNTLNIPVEIIACPTLREEDGLAMSSRNTLLTPDERKNAPFIYKTLLEAKETQGTISQIKKWVTDQINSNHFMKLEYFEIVNAETLMPLHSVNDAKEIRACIAVKMGSVRLIDNIPF